MTIMNYKKGKWFTLKSHLKLWTAKVPVNDLFAGDFFWDKSYTAIQHY